MSVSVAVMSDDEIVVAGIRAVLEPYPHRVRVKQIDSRDPIHTEVDVLLDDPSSPQPAHPRTPDRCDTAGCLAVLGWHGEPTRAHARLRDGVDGYISRRSSPEQLVEAIERVHRGERVLPDAADQAIGAASPERWLDDEVGLSAREVEVLGMVCQGVSNADIAARTYLSTNTIKTYSRSASRKIDVETRARAVIWGYSNGLVTGAERGRGASGLRSTDRLDRSA